MSPIKIENPSGANVGTADQDYFLDENGNVTTDDQKAATLLIRKGQDVPKEMADKYFSGKSAKAVSATDETADVESADEGKKASSPKSNKAASPKANKGAK